MQPSSEFHDLRARCHAPGDARDWMTGVCGPHELAVHGRGRLRFRHAGHRLGAMTTSIGVVEYGRDVEIHIDAGTPLRCYSVSLPLEGEQELRAAGRSSHSRPGTGCIVAPADTQTLWISGRCRKLIVALDQARVRAELERLLGRPLDHPLRVAPVSDTLAGATASWWQLVQHLATELANPGSLYHDPRFAAELERMLIRGWLLAQPHTYSDALAAARTRREPPHVERLREFLVAHARGPVTSADLPVATGVSRSKAYADFKTHHGVSPLVYLKRHRLQQAREQIIEYPTASAVSEAAMDWGFFHLGRFAQEYRAQFGEPPSETARRARCAASRPPATRGVCDDRRPHGSRGGST